MCYSRASDPHGEFSLLGCFFLLFLKINIEEKKNRVLKQETARWAVENQQQQLPRLEGQNGHKSDLFASNEELLNVSLAQFVFAVDLLDRQTSQWVCSSLSSLLGRLAPFLTRLYWLARRC